MNSSNNRVKHSIPDSNSLNKLQASLEVFYYDKMEIINYLIMNKRFIMTLIQKEIIQIWF